MVPDEVGAEFAEESGTKLGLVPHCQPACPLPKSLSHFCRKYCPEGRFFRLVSAVPSTICGFSYNMAWEEVIGIAQTLPGQIVA